MMGNSELRIGVMNINITRVGNGVSNDPMKSISNPLLRIGICVAAVLSILAVYLYALPAKPAVASFTLLIAVLIVASNWGMRYAIFLAVIATVAFSFLLPPVGSVKVSDSRDLVTLFFFLISAVIAGRLSDNARTEALNATRRRIEAEAAEKRFEYLVNSVNGIVWEADATCLRFLFVSRQAERVLGYPVKRWLSEPTFWQDHLHPEDRGWAVQFFLNATFEKGSHDIQYRMLAADGRVVWLRDVVSVVVENDRAVRLMGVMVDITRRKRTEEALRQAEADLAHATRVTTLGELTASLAHEIKQPISAAITDANTCMRWLTREPPDLGEARQAASRMIKDGTRASEIITRIRLLFKKSAPQRELLDLNEVIQEMTILLRGEAARYSITVRTELAPDLPKIMADRVQLQQVFMNLMLNGIDAMKNMTPAGELTVHSQQDGNGGLLVSVNDTGEGLPAGKADQIFEAFFTTKPQGTGLGLSISRSIIESHGGRLWATGNSGQGATFQFILPADLKKHELGSAGAQDHMR
jgi:PAS domain S-box-containing protein